MTKSLFVTVIVALLGPFANGASMHCADVDAVIQEAIPYHMTGAPTTDLPIDCAKRTKWQYFSPSSEHKSDPYNNPDFIWFEPGRDKYTIDKTTPRKDGGYDIDVTFTINKKVIHMTYQYTPKDQMQKYAGSCGSIFKKGKPWVMRADCKAPEKPKAKPAAKPKTK